MADRTFAQEVTHAARTVARLEARRRVARKKLAEVDEQYREAQRTLRLVVQTTEPYTPPTKDETAAAAAAADGLSRERNG